MHRRQFNRTKDDRITKRGVVLQPAFVQFWPASKHSCPHDRHRQEQRIQTRVVKPFSDVAPVARITRDSLSGTSANAAAVFPALLFFPCHPFKTKTCLPTSASLDTQASRFT